MTLRYKFSVFFILFILFTVFLNNIGSIASFVVLSFIFFMLFKYGTVFFGSSWKPMKKGAIEKVSSIIGRNDNVYDIGCGDGRGLSHARKSKNCRVTGIEIDPIKCIISYLRVRGWKKDVSIVFGSMYRKSLRDADVIIAYLPQTTLDELQNKFLSEMKKGSRVITCVSVCKKLCLVKEFKKDRVYVYSNTK